MPAGGSPVGAAVGSLTSAGPSRPRPPQPRIYHPQRPPAAPRAPPGGDVKVASDVACSGDVVRLATSRLEGTNDVTRELRLKMSPAL